MSEERSSKDLQTVTVIERLEEWHRHQYDPGYYVGARRPPFLVGRHPNRYGWVLLVSGALAIAGGGIALWSGGDWQGWSLSDLITYAWPFLLGALMFIAGICLLRLRR